MRLSRIILISSLVTFAKSFSNNGAIRNVDELLEPLLARYNAPALGGLILNATGEIQAYGVAGIRRRGSTVNVTSNDLWHLASNTKAMTATLVARFVESGTVNWEDTVGDVFSSLQLPSVFYSINFIHLLSHRSGIPGNTDWHYLSFSATTTKGQRLNAVKALNDTELIGNPGERYLYSNWGYVVAGAMLEEITGEFYEDLMRRLIFEPLGMDSAGHGPTSGNTEFTQPWGHDTLGRPVQSDNPLVFGPARNVHVSLEDWAKFILDHLRGSLGLPALLAPQSYNILHTAPFNGNYALGWTTGEISWGQGPILQHAGTNTMNYALVVIDPAAGIAVLSVCNQGDEEVLNVLVAAANPIGRFTLKE